MRRVMADIVKEVIRVDPVCVRHHQRAAAVVEQRRLDRLRPDIDRLRLREGHLVADRPVIFATAAGVLILERPEVDLASRDRPDDVVCLRPVSYTHL